MSSLWGSILLLTILTVVAFSSVEGNFQHDKNNGSNNTEESKEEIDYRLPTSIIPKSYEIMLNVPYNEKFTTFSGTVVIQAFVETPTNKVVFHVGKIKIIIATVTFLKKIPISVNKTTYDPVTEKYTIILKSELLAKQDIMIGIKFEGALRDDMIGFYRSSYIDKNGDTRWLAATQFQSIHARHAFPCFDEPSFKANFTIRIRRPKELQCLSNMRLVSSKETLGDFVWDSFGETVVMSTYLVAFVISDFAHLANKEGNFTVWARPDAINEAHYALEVGPRALRYLSDLFGMPYQLDKMDMVAVPDFAAGAMENWGIITYREARMLYDENISSVWSQQKIASVIVHETVHMWFGNLVTPEWWGYLWLSEGFARYYEYMATGKLEPSWKMEQQFVVDELQTVYAVDALDSASPMTRIVSNTAEIGTSGDTITYAKAASVIRMMELSFGSEVFSLALHEYLQTKKYTSARPEDLWSALQHQGAGKNLRLKASVETVMNTWTKQAGFPVLSVNITNGTALLNQNRFFLRNPNSSPVNFIWWIPITWTSGRDRNFDSTSPRLWLGSPTAAIDLSSDRDYDDDWFIFNIQEAGYYRVNYDKVSWERIIGVLMSERFEDIHEINRAAIVDDLLNLARASLLDYDTALTGLNYIKRETNYLPFKAAFAGLEYLHKRFAGQPNYGYIKNHSLSIITNIYDNLGYEDRPNDDRLTILLRQKVNNWACKLDHERCIEKSLFYFTEWRNKSKPIAKNQREAAYCSAIRYGSSEDWNFLWDQFLKSNCATDQIVILGALACSRNTTILESYLLKAITHFQDSRIRKQDSTTVFNAVYSSSVSSAGYILEFVRKYFTIMKEYDGGYGIVGTVLTGASRYFSTEELVVEFEELMNEYAVEFATILKSLRAALNLAKYELEWYEDNEPDIMKWMRKNNKNVVDTSNTTDYRLPKSILPESYEIKVTPYIEEGKFTFDGRVKITTRVVEDTTKIVLHADKIILHSAFLQDDGKILNIKSFRRDLKYNFWTIDIVGGLTAGTNLSIEIDYVGQLNTAMRGFYRSSYVDDSGTTRWLAATHLEPVGARRMFPCFDEPALKATFILSVNRPANYSAISNTPLNTSVPDGNGRVLDTFQKTPTMSTYLVALLVSDFKSLVDKENHCAVWARPNAVDQGEYALSVMAPLVRFYEKAVGHPYQLAKLDMVALPDFASGAMENWGLLTYREKNMLYDPKHSPITSKQSIADSISHEISHQWFGDQVSPRWWKYLWLSEGFAQYFQYYGTANVETEWGFESQFVVEQLHTAFETDARASTHPMTHDVYSPTEISAIFDSISYAKAASVLRMVEKTIGADLFYGALYDYLEARRNKDAIPDHLIEAFQARINSNGTTLETTMKTIMDTWITQAGYPVVSVNVTGTVASLSQKRFYVKNYEETTSESMWWIPVTWASRSKPDFATTSPKYWMSKENAELKLDAADEWIILNVQESGYYRVNYDSESWERIINVLKGNDYDIIHEVNRASLIDDLLALGQAGLVDYAVTLSATQYLINETNYIPWRAAIRGLAYFNRRFNGREIFESYKKHILHILNPIYEKLGFGKTSTEPHYDKLLRRYVVNWACNLNVESCIDSSLILFAAWKNDSTPVPVDLRATIYCTVMKYGTMDDWEFLWSQYLAAGVSTEKVVILTALGCSRNTSALEKLLTRAITENSEIRSQDSSSVFTAVYSSGLFGAEYTLDFVESNYQEIYKYYGDHGKIASILGAASTFLSTEELVLKFEKYIERNEESLRPIVSSLKNNLNIAYKELAWYDKYSPRIFEWLDKTYPSEDYRLPTTIYPQTYDIYLKPHLEENKFTFDGETTISMQVEQNTSSIVLHAHELTIRNIIVYIDLDNYLNVLSHTINTTNHRFTIYLDTIIPAGRQLTVYITYTGVLNDKMIGFYRSSYVNENGNTRWLAATHLEPVGARRMFPCFDEPALKATFILSVNRPANYSVISNTPLNTSVLDGNGRVLDTFQKTPTMSTYLVALLVSDFESLVDQENHCAVWARPNAVDQGKYALSVMAPLLRFYEKAVGHPYQLVKLDMVALPDFASGAMENWGLLTYREKNMLYDPKHSPITSKQSIANVISHEISHQWFGNQVSPRWWKYLWLSEGFARYFQYYGTANVETEWGLESQFVVEQLQAAFETDGRASTHPMTHDVYSPSEISAIFDSISYAKAASVLRMVEKSIGTDLFYGALFDYLGARKNKDAIPDHLIEAFQAKMNSNGMTLETTMKTIMDTWITQAGYPVVSVNITGTVALLSQKRFYLKNYEATTSESIWWIPVTWASRSRPDFTTTSPKYWLSTENAAIKLDAADEWVILNVQESGYYRVNYDSVSWERIINVLKGNDYDIIHEVNRASLIDDLLALGQAGLVDYAVTLSATQYLINETNYIPWRAAFNGLAYFNRRFNGREIFESYKKHILHILNPMYEKLGFDETSTESHYDKLLRRYVVNWVCNLNEESCIGSSLIRFAAWKNNSTPVPVDLRATIYCTAMKYGTMDDWEFLWSQYLATGVSTEKVVILTALGCSRHTTALEKLLTRAITENSEIRSQDSSSVFSAVYSSGLFGAEYTLDFVESNYQDIYKYYGDHGKIASILGAASTFLSTEELVLKFEKYMERNEESLRPIASSLKNYLNIAHKELAWYDKYSPRIFEWLDKTYPSEDYRLPITIYPQTYDIYLKPHLEENNFTFEGETTINMQVEQSTSSIVLHAHELTIRNIIVYIDLDNYLKVLSHTINTTNHRFTIYLDTIIPAGRQLTVYITYIGVLNDKMIGFYRSSYVNNNGNTRWLAATDLEPVGARRMFPCFDEPALKATFILTVNRPANYSVISNTPLNTSVLDGNGRVLDTFQKTPTMSTYLVALVVSDFERLVDQENHCAVWARPNAVDQGQYALSVMAPLLRFYEKAVGHPYQLAKLDMVALPDFSSGAMENWGLLTYRENSMLYDPKHSPITSKQAIANLISHEISHQWFGDQVSPRWWKYLWLSEGFAQYFQYYGTANVNTEWGLESQFVVEQLQAAFETDARASTHPMTHDVYSPTEISAIFDRISYAKAASVLRMVEKTIGADLFYGALSDYLEARKNKDAIPDHLIEAFQAKINSNGTPLETTMKTIMDTWITQAGYPVVSVNVTGTVASLSQKRFYLKNYEATTSKSIWWIPVTWASQSRPDFTTTSPEYWMSKENAEIKLDAADEWVILNVQESGYYRVNYDSVSWERIINVLKGNDYDIIHEVNRASLIDDLLALGQAGLVDYAVTLSATQYLINETNYIPWRAAFNGLAYFNRRFNGREIFESYKKHILHILNPMYKKLGFDETSTESHYDKLLRRYVVNWVCNLNVESCIGSSLILFAAWKNNSTPVPVDLRATIYCTAMKYGTMDDWEFLWSQYLAAGVSTEKVVILTALGCSRNTTALEKLLTRAITENSEIRSQDSSTVFTAVYSSGLFGAEYTLDFVETNYQDIYKYYGDHDTIASILGAVTSFLSTEGLVLKFEKYIERNEEILRPIVSSLKTNLNIAYKELAWYDKYSPIIFEWLDKTYPSEDYRLPTTIYPQTYDIYLKPHLEENNFTFEGETTINMQVEKSTSSIVLHAHQLTIRNIIAYIDSVNYLKVLSHSINKTNHRFTIYLDTIVPAGSHLSVYIDYAGILNDKMIGFYRSSYVDKNGNTRWLASTQFQPVYARQAFPCFDEPAFKAKFKIHIERPNDYRSLSNMPWTSSLPSTANRTWDSYEQSVSMSSYLVAFVVSDFESIKNRNGTFAVWARPEVVQYGSYALDVGQKVLQFLENFSAIDYPIKKMDLIAIPDFRSGAMENWGLITFREYGLLQHENVTSATYKKYLHETVTHEIVHMWFGNLVTCDWWDYIWLHEGFAQYLQTVVGHIAAPDWNLPQQFVVNELHSAMQFDTSPNVHPMNNRVVEPEAIADSFDGIAYGKSASVLRMMHHALGRNLFESGLRTYLERRKYKTAVPDDLSSAIQFHVDRETSPGNLNIAIKSLMDSWTNNPGYPVVNVTLTAGSLTLVQERFFFTRPNKTADESEYWIPITVTTRSKSNFTSTNPNFWFGEKRTNMSLPLENDEWFLMNIQQTGYYRVNYDVDSWNRLITALRTGKNFDGIHAINRAQIVDDLLNLARIDYVPYDLALEASKYLARENDHLPWKAFFTGVTFLNRHFDGHKIGRDFAKYVVTLVQRVYGEIGFVDLPDEHQLDQLNRELILGWTCKFGHSGCVEVARKLFDDWQTDEEKWISPNARPAVYCTAIKHGNHTHWQFLWDEYKKTEFSSEQLVILRALGCSRNVTTLNNYLKLAISTDNVIRNQDVATALESVSNADSFGVNAMLDFLMNNYNDLWQYYSNWASVGNLFKNVAGKISTEEQIKKLELFVNSSSSELAEIRTSLKSALDSAKRNYEWFRTHETHIHNWLIRESYIPESSTDTTTERASSVRQISSLALTITSLCLVFAIFYHMAV